MRSAKNLGSSLEKSRKANSEPLDQLQLNQVAGPVLAYVHSSPCIYRFLSIKRYSPHFIYSTRVCGKAVWIISTCIYLLSQTPPLGAKCKQKNQFYTEFKEDNGNGMDTSLEWKIGLGRRRFTSGHRTVGREEEERNNHGRTKWHFMKSRNMEEDRHLRSLGMDRRLWNTLYNSMVRFNAAITRDLQ